MKNIKGFVVITTLLTAVVLVRGTTIYDNSTTQIPNNLMLTNNQLVGDEILLGASAPYLTNFSIEYYSPNHSFSGSVLMDVSFYQTNGTPFSGYGSPGTLFYNSGWFGADNPWTDNPGTNYLVADFSLTDLLAPPGSGSPLGLNPTYQLPNDFIVVVSFQGLTGADQVGMAIFNPATVGNNYGDYWYDNAGSWELLTNESSTVAFGMQLNSTPEPTPEPAVWGLTAAGSLILAGLARRRRK